MEKRIEEVRNIKPGRYVLIDDVPCKVTNVTHSKPGKHGGAKAKIDASGIFNNQKKSVIKPTGDKIEVPVIEKKAAQILNIIGNQVQLMDMESYETFELPMPEEEELSKNVAAGVEALYIQVGPERKIFQIKGK